MVWGSMAFGPEMECIYEQRRVVGWVGWPNPQRFSLSDMYELVLELVVLL